MFTLHYIAALSFVEVKKKGKNNKLLSYTSLSGLEKKNVCLIRNWSPTSNFGA